jgi:DNA invertase Pin-like site-specific DNA recombinase
MSGKIGIYVRTSIDKENTSIDQQKKLGIQFSKKNKLEYQIYEDIGKSGFKIEDEENPFKNRSGLTKLINDIENKIIDKVWVFEHSRLSRNDYTSILLSRIFQKHNITVYENDQEFDFNNPQSQMIQGILSKISQYERHLITSRTTRGVRDLINQGQRSYNEFYGYKNDGKKEGKYLKWIPVNSELENVKYCYKKYLQGNSVKSIITDIYKESPNGTLIHKWVRILRHFENTGFSLNTDGLEIYNKFKKCEIDSIKELNNKKYYVKSINFPIKSVSIEDWITVVEKLQGYKKIYKDRMRRTDTEIFTGLVNCPYCESRYYICNDKVYSYYKHSPNKKCLQSPKSFNVKKMNNLIEVFFFYFYLIYDDTKTLIQESQQIIKMNQLEVREKIKNIESENHKIEKQINNFQSIYEDSNDIDKLNLILEKEKELKQKKEKNDNSISKLKTELDELKEKYNSDELELTYYDVKNNVVNFFEKMSIEEKRTSLIKIIKNCQVFNKHLVIDTGKLLFVFDTKKEYELTEQIYNKFKRDKGFKDNFLNSSKVVDDEGVLTDKFFEFVGSSEKELLKKYNQKDIDKFFSSILHFFLVRHLGDISIKEFYLEDKDIIDTKKIMRERLSNIGIKYDISNIEKVVSFTEL